ncbi:hypothetical protein [Polaromonas sp. JS666]|uniref:hypothetical protein n=1 Tax=Polaromonas sp. (strain JS666 / ATCC BAA-500) TaxID=296591 RepID=UPI0009430E92|nr:hypothetical protein [Polaromonas sp. JS666]
MNIKLGLERISVVWWGLWAVLALLTGASLIFSSASAGDTMIGFVLLGALIPIYIAHRLTCWIIAGFFGSK